MVEYPTIDRVGDQWRMWFCGNGFGSVGYAEGIVETSLKLYYRSSPTDAVDAHWSEWQALARGARSEAYRFVQLKAEFRSENPNLSPALNSVTLTPSSSKP